MDLFNHKHPRCINVNTREKCPKTKGGICFIHESTQTKTGNTNEKITENKCTRPIHPQYYITRYVPMLSYTHRVEGDNGNRLTNKSVGEMDKNEAHVGRARTKRHKLFHTYTRGEWQKGDGDGERMGEGKKGRESF